MSVDGVKSVSFNTRENKKKIIAQAIKPTTVELKLNTTLRVVPLAVATYLLHDIINISTWFGFTPMHISNLFLCSWYYSVLLWTSTESSAFITLNSNIVGMFI